MGNCIYYCDKHRGLTYDNREHIISSAIGGRRTLPKGYVSDQANNFLSKYELSYIRYSPLFIARAKFGPGKRGSSNFNKIDDPDVLSMEPTERDNDNYICPLGFLFLDKVYIIPQFVVAFDNDLQDFDVIYLKQNHPYFKDIEGLDWNSKIEDFMRSYNKHYKKIPIPYKTKKHFSCIGWYKKKWFFSSTFPNASFDETLQLIQQRKPSLQASEKLLGFSPSTPTFHYSREIPLENISYSFLHAKNCFNTLAFFKGNEFVRQKMFDRFRECILTNSKWEGVFAPPEFMPPYIKQWLRKKVCGNEHVVVLYVHESDIMAFSVIYGKSWGLFRLGTGYLNTPFLHAIVCDFENENKDKDEKIFDELTL